MKSKLKLEYKKVLIEKYWGKNFTTRQLAKYFNVDQATIVNWMKKLNIKRRNASESNSKLFLTKKELTEEYIKKNQTQTQIAKKFNVNASSIRRKLIKYNISLRKQTLKNGHSHNYIGGRPHCIDCGKLVWWAFKRCQSCAQKELWSNETHRQKQIKLLAEARKISPNSKELFLNYLLQLALFKEYKFVGDGKILFCGFNPDFININGQKKIIELYGDYWHNRPEVKERDKRRLIAYNRYGYETLIIWEHELKQPEKVIAKVMEFHL